MAYSRTFTAYERVGHSGSGPTGRARASRAGLGGPRDDQDGAGGAPVASGAHGPRTDRMVEADRAVIAATSAAGDGLGPDRRDRQSGPAAANPAASAPAVGAISRVGLFDVLRPGDGAGPVAPEPVAVPG